MFGYLEALGPVEKVGTLRGRLMATYENASGRHGHGQQPFRIHVLPILEMCSWKDLFLKPVVDFRS